MRLRLYLSNVLTPFAICFSITIFSSSRAANKSLTVLRRDDVAIVTLFMTSLDGSVVAGGIGWFGVLNNNASYSSEKDSENPSNRHIL